MADFDALRPETTPATAPTTVPATEATPLATEVAPSMTALLTDLPADLALAVVDLTVTPAGFEEPFAADAAFSAAEPAAFAAAAAFVLAPEVDFAAAVFGLSALFADFAVDERDVGDVFVAEEPVLLFAPAASFDLFAIASPAPVLAVTDLPDAFLPVVSLIGVPSVDH